MKHSMIWIISILTFSGMGLTSSVAMAIDGPLANATVSFGQWETDPPLDRLVGDPTGGVGVSDTLIPDNVTIKEGGAINFIIGGGHVVAVYDNGTKPGDIDTSVIEPATRCPTTAGGVINDPGNRIYRGPCFSTNVGTTPSTTIVRRDGVEVVQFSKPGTYLVICARKTHFDNGMFGFVKVLPGK